MRLRWARWAWLPALLLLLSATALAAAPEPRTLLQAEAVASDWQARQPPAHGWTPVALPDLWTTRWPGHDGVVWYRLRWQQQGDAPIGLLLDYVCLADAVYLNGSLIHRDPSLVEPLTRSWVRPQYMLLDRPLLRDGQNELLVRVSGLAAYQPGFGKVLVGAPELVQARYRAAMLWRHDAQLFAVAVGLVLGALFGLFWLFRRQQTVYGWYALSAWLFALYGCNYIVTRPWPFTRTDGWQAFVAALYLAAACSFALFLLRYCRLRRPWLERTLGVASLLAFAAALLWPQMAGPNRLPAVLLGGAVYYCGMVMFIVHAWRGQDSNARLLAACLLLPLLTSAHDFLVYFGVLPARAYLLALTSPLTMIGLGSVLAHRFAVAMRRIENFNEELRVEVDAATRLLGQTLQREHQLALTHTRASERLQLVRDLHDGFGGSLVSTLAALEQGPPTPESMRAVASLKELRDDLRLVIDTTAHEQDLDLPALLASLRHRWTQRFERAGVAMHWTLEGLAGLHLGPARSLDLLRFLQEALTNVLKHAAATRVQVRLQWDGRILQVQVSDDGHGFDVASATAGAGLASLRARAHRLRAEFTLQARQGQGTHLSLSLPQPALQTAPP
ncbi:TPA: ATP-binding protein [Stenotrophomonas maltophilia]|nr:ATP-binding protein [Stenotrophomonas maltophilia]HDS1042270.1 ATP-binding protein [Stenotrophomonas maltophilia]